MDFLLLKEIMEGELNEVSTLAELSRQEKEAVIENDVPLLSAIVERQQLTLSAIKKLETKKDNLLAGIREASSLPDGKLCVMDVIQNVQGEMRGELESLAKDIENTSKELRRISKVNKMLINTQLNYTSFCINTLTGQENTSGIYSDSGHVSEEPAMKHCIVDQAI